MHANGSSSSSVRLPARREMTSSSKRIYTLASTLMLTNGRAPVNTSATITDPFLKQKRTTNWNQELISSQIALVLGVGGVGSTVAMNLVRLGFKKLFLIDCDVVEDHNLNRQVLYGKGLQGMASSPPISILYFRFSRVEDVGRPKVLAAVDGLRHHNVGGTELVPLHIDAVAEWGRVVDCARQATCIFNGIDHGGVHMSRAH